MKTLKVSNLVKVAATTIGIISMTGTGANAGVLSNGTTINNFLECLNDGIGLVVDSNTAQNGWHYATDANNDRSGPVGYEIFGMGVKETEDSILVALSANTPLTGVNEAVSNQIPDGNIGWGDMFFNFSGKDFMTAMNNGQLFGVKFAATNDSPVANVGLYGGVTATSVTSQNQGYASINAYNSSVGSKASLGDLAADTNYFDKTKSLNAIASGNYLGGITFLNAQELAAAGFNSNQFAGQDIAFKIDKSKLPGGASVPEPATIAGLAIVGAVLGGSKLRKSSAIAKKA